MAIRAPSELIKNLEEIKNGNKSPKKDYTSCIFGYASKSAHNVVQLQNCQTCEDPLYRLVFLAPKKGHQWQYKKTYRMLVQLLSLFPGTFVWVEKQMTGGWTRNVIISFLSPLTVAAGRTGEGTAETLVAFVLQCTESFFSSLSCTFPHWDVLHVSSAVSYPVPDGYLIPDPTR